MALFNYATKEITLKIVYYGPGLSGKTTNLQYLHTVLNPDTKGKLLSLSTESDRTLFFDFLPIELGKIRDFSIRFQLYTVPGQVRYNATRKVVLKGADGVVFVTDSQKDMKDQNIESFENMQENLISNNIDPESIPIILQYNKRDLKNILTIEELNQDLHISAAHQVIEAAAISGMGVEETFRGITRLVIKDISKKHKIEIQPAQLKSESVVSKKPAGEVKPEVKAPTILDEAETTEIQSPASSTPPAFEIDPFELADDDLEIVSDFEPDVIEILGEAEPLEAEYEPEFMRSSAYDAVAEVESGIHAQEPIFKESVPSESTAPLTDILEEASSAEVMPDERETSEKHLQPFPIEKIEGLSEELALLSGRLSRISDSMDRLQRSVLELKGDVVLMKNSMSLIQDKSDKIPSRKDAEELINLKREQKEISVLLRDVLDLLSCLKEKKSWFRL